ncbi:MAG: hypothetical protein ACFFD1_11705 [Candidatus Thorarchaeota archaeon]
MGFERLREFLGDDFALLNKPAIYLSKNEKWRILQGLLLMFGAEAEEGKIIIFKPKEAEKEIEEINQHIQEMLNIKTDISWNKEKNSWEINLIDFK